MYTITLLHIYIYFIIILIIFQIFLIFKFIILHNFNKKTKKDKSF